MNRMKELNLIKCEPRLSSGTVGILQSDCCCPDSWISAETKEKCNGAPEDSLAVRNLNP